MPRRMVGDAYVPKGGSCLKNMECHCSEPIVVNGYCPTGITRCVAEQGSYCRYLCESLSECDAITAEECEQSNPCNS